MKQLISLVIWVLWMFILQNKTFGLSGCLAWASSCELIIPMMVEVYTGNICIWTDSSFSFGTYTVSASAQTLTGSFTGYFYVDDLKSSESGYYTTVQMSGHLVGTWWAVISWSNVYMRTTSTWITLLAWMTGDHKVSVDNNMLSFQSLDVPRQLIVKGTWATDLIVAKYGTIPEMQLIVPAYQPVWIYTAILIYTLYEN